MKILIAKANEPFFKELDEQIKFNKATKNTSWFSISEKKYEQLVKTLREWGFNTFALMSVI
jgi:hypothetical protein